MKLLNRSYSRNNRKWTQFATHCAPVFPSKNSENACVYWVFFSSLTSVVMSILYAGYLLYATVTSDVLY